MDDRIEWYLDKLRYEFEKLRDGKFVGNIHFEAHIKDGNIGNIVVGLNKSIKYECMKD